MTDDIEAVLAVTNRDMDAVVHTVPDEADALFTWDYEKGARPGLSKLYEKAKTSQWNGATDLDWSIDVDPILDLNKKRPAEVERIALELVDALERAYGRPRKRTKAKP